MSLGRGSLGAVACALAACGCTVGPDYLKPAAIVPAQYKELKGWKAASPRDDVDRGAWWRVFGDSELDRLEAQVSISNQTIKADEANYREAQALIAEGRSQLYPTVNFDPSVTRSGGGTGSSASATTNISAEISASWTLDVWGKIRRTIESNVAGAEVSAADLANAKLSAQSSLAIAYVQLRDDDSLHDLLDDTVAQYKRALDITQNQYSAGTAARSDVITAQAQVLAAQAQEIDTGVARATNEHAIAVLMGRPPAGLSVSHRKLTERIPSVPTGLPSTLLERRPDIAVAERTMAEDNALIGVAIAAYYPDITLSGLFGYLGSPTKAALAANPMWSYGLSAAQTLFNGGLTAAQVEAARDTYEASVATYRQTVLTAFQQVEDELATIRILAREAAVQVEAVKAAQQAVQIALNEYRAGTQNFTTVVTAEATALTDEETELATREQRVAAVVNLIVALGGGWSVSALPTLASN
jgi:NodT family efflux transporter outer membrane factor (OMF) lipoprotein